MVGGGEGVCFCRTALQIRTGLGGKVQKEGDCRELAMIRAGDLNGELLASSLFWVGVVCLCVHMCTREGFQVKGVDPVSPNFSDHRNPSEAS